jgi:hypothetical protein
MPALLLLLIFVPMISLAGELKGSIRDEQGKPLPGAAIVLSGLSRGAYSDKDGNYILKNINIGDYQAEARSVGYITQKKNISFISAEQSITLNFNMKASSLLTKGVEVSASRRQAQSDTRTSILTISPKEAKFKAGAAEDVFRSLQTLPGVTAPNDFSSQLIIRGSGPDQNLIVMDNIELFNPYRLYGFVSMFNPETVNQISLMTGGFPARYSDRLSAVLDINNRDGSQDSYFGGKANISLTNANIVMEGKLPLLNGSWIISTRRTYYDLIAGPIARASGAVDGDVALPNFRDIQAKFTLRPNEFNQISINLISSRDNTQLTSASGRAQPDSISIFDKSFNDVAGITWRWTPDTNFLLSSTASWYDNTGSNSFGGSGGSQVIAGGDVSREEFERLQDSLRQAGLDVPTLFSVEGNTGFSFQKKSLRSDLLWRTGTAHTFEAGIMADFISTGVNFDVKFDPRLIALRRSNPRIPELPETFGTKMYYNRYGGYIQDNIRVMEGLTVQAGLRFDYFGILDKSYVAPRLSMAYALSPISTFRAAWGYYYQSPGYEKLLDRQSFFDFTRPETKNLRAEKAEHLILGLEHMLSTEWQLRIEGYYKGFSDLIVQEKLRGTGYKVERIDSADIKTRAGWTAPIAYSTDSLTTVPVNGATGSAWGFEILLQKVHSEGENNLYGWVSYSFAKAVRKRDGLILPFNFDRRHTLNIVGGWRISSSFDINFTWTYGSGFPWTGALGITPRVVQVKDTNTGQMQSKIDTDWRGVVFNVDRGGEANINQTRLPDYHRLDIRFTTYTNWFGLKWTVYLDIINVYNRSNILSVNYRVNRENLQIEKRETSMLPILPTFGFSVLF